jgi:hypothetical protein
MAIKSSFLIVLSILISIALLPSMVSPYILPSSQIIAVMTKKFALIKTLTITQQTTINDEYQDKEKTIKELVSLSSPYFYRSTILRKPGKRLVVHNRKETLRIISNKIAHDGESYDFMYRFLLLSQNPELLLEMLKEMGIDLEEVSLTRFEGTIAYLIGKKENGSAGLVIDKELFFPLLLKYGDCHVRFSEYSECMKHTWYPFQIIYACERGITEKYRVMNIKVNPPMDVSLFDIPKMRAKFSNREFKQEE